MLRLYQDGKLDLENMNIKKYAIDEAPQAFEDPEQVKRTRCVMVFE